MDNTLSLVRPEVFCHEKLTLRPILQDKRLKVFSYLPKTDLTPYSFAMEYNMLTFSVMERSESGDYRPQNTVVLKKDNWDDWGKYNTQYYLTYFDDHRNNHDIGYVKIGCPEPLLESKRPPTGKRFPMLGAEFYSLGQSDEYYSNLMTLGPEVSGEILRALNDVVFNPEFYCLNKMQPVMTDSLQRYVSESTILGQFSNIINGRQALSHYRFSCDSESVSADVHFVVNVIPESFPPTNIHTIIGNNGVGKSHFLKAITRSLRFKEGDMRVGMLGDNIFANLIAVSFSAFENFDMPSHDQQSLIHYSYIGLNKSRPQNDAVDLYRKSYPDDKYELGFDFITSLQACKYSPKKELWLDVIQQFNWNDTTQQKLAQLVNNDATNEYQAVSQYDSIQFFNSLSSGHKIVLLTLTSLVEKIEEKSLVLFDEPEVHLHPPMLSSLVRALSFLLIKTNGVALVATHSPVVLQEVPASCVTVLSRPGTVTKSFKPSYETFGENVSLLTHLVFGLDNTHSGYVNLLKEKVHKGQTFDSILAETNGQLGSEAITILASLMD